MEFLWEIYLTAKDQAIWFHAGAILMRLALAPIKAEMEEQLK